FSEKGGGGWMEVSSRRGVASTNQYYWPIARRRESDVSVNSEITLRAQRHGGCVSDRKRSAASRSAAGQRGMHHGDRPDGPYKVCRNRVSVCERPVSNEQSSDANLNVPVVINLRFTFLNNPGSRAGRHTPNGDIGSRANHMCVEALWAIGGRQRD